jgi:signal peptidase I
MKKKDFKKYWNKFWYIMWKDESFKGWIISIAVLFVFIKFIFLPSLCLITGTALPLAIVESCSMYHDGNLFSDYDEWWKRQEDKYSSFDIEKEEFKEFVFKKGFNKGDILFVIEAKPEKVKIGDVIIFEASRENPLIHRVIDIEINSEGDYVFSTIGDNNNGQLSVEKVIESDRLVGKAVFKIVPYLGWGKLMFYEFLRPSNERGFCEEN